MLVFNDITSLFQNPKLIKIMVYLTRAAFNYFTKPKKPLRRYLKLGFLDSLNIYVKGGSGGNGLPKFGGVGGQGGNVIAVGTESITLVDVYKRNKSKRFLGQSGRHSSHNFILGMPGEDIKVEVPVGVTVHTEQGKTLGEVNAAGEELILARGGPGGHPKNGFLGIKGQARYVKLDLKLIADIGLVGFPNAGKSTLLKAISNANPRIANYPFTTIKPNLGIMEYKDLRQISVADLPGLIEGAHANRGMGHEFLRHVERTKLLLLVVDINGFQLGYKYPHRSCLDTIVLLNKELELYNPDLLSKPALIIINKMDTEGATTKLDEIKHKILNISEIFKEYSEDMRPEIPLKFDDLLPISALESTDIEMVKNKLRQSLDVNAELEKKRELEENAQHMTNIKENLRERGPRLV